MCSIKIEGGTDRWIVVTTINHPTRQLEKLSKLEGWQLIVVGDKKTPSDWHLDRCIYLSPEDQVALGYRITSLLPWNHYCRKNIGYLYTIQHGAKIIYDTDDDNEPLEEISPCPQDALLPYIETNQSVFNMYRYFGEPHVWPRGFPLKLILQKDSLSVFSHIAC